MFSGSILICMSMVDPIYMFVSNIVCSNVMGTLLLQQCVESSNLFRDASYSVNFMDGLSHTC